jgi:hypothetical protein
VNADHVQLSRTTIYEGMVLSGFDHDDVAGHRID